MLIVWFRNKQTNVHKTSKAHSLLLSEQKSTKLRMSFFLDRWSIDLSMDKILCEVWNGISAEQMSRFSVSLTFSLLTDGLKTMSQMSGTEIQLLWWAGQRQLNMGRLHVFPTGSCAGAPALIGKCFFPYINVQMVKWCDCNCALITNVPREISKCKPMLLCISRTLFPYISVVALAANQNVHRIQ